MSLFIKRPSFLESMRWVGEIELVGNFGKNSTTKLNLASCPCMEYSWLNVGISFSQRFCSSLL